MSTPVPSDGEARQTPRGDAASEVPDNIDLEALARLLQVDDASAEALARRLIAVGEQMLSHDSPLDVAAADLQTANRRDEEIPRTEDPEPAQTSAPSTNQQSTDQTSTGRLPSATGTTSAEPSQGTTDQGQRAGSPVTIKDKEESGHATNDQGQRAVPRHFVPTAQYDLGAYACPESGQRYRQTAQPGNDTGIVPIPCDKCEKCVAYRKWVKAQQYFIGRRSDTATTLVGLFSSPHAAGAFASRKAHDRRIPGIRRFAILKQSAPFGPDQPCVARIIWDGVANADQLSEAVQHAVDNGSTNITTDILQVSEAQFLEWLPNRFSIVTSEPDEHGTRKSVNTCRYSNGWPQPVDMPSDWRGGRSTTVRVPYDSPPRNEARLDSRGSAIRRSWRTKFAENPDDPEAVRALERARYINTVDWLTHWETAEYNNIEACQQYIDQYLAGRKPSVREWQNTTNGPRQLVDQTARWLRQQREPEPAVVMISERLGYIQPGPEPAIDPQYLTELTSQLPEFVIFDPV